MAETRNIIILGASGAGIPATHYTLKHIIPALKKTKPDVRYHVYTIAPSSRYLFRNATPRVATSTQLMSTEKIVWDLNDSFKQYSPDDFTFIEGTAIGLDTTARTVTFRGNKKADDTQLPYHALIIATGSTTFYPAFSASTGIDDALNAIETSNENIKKAKSIVIVGGGPTGVEFAGEVGEFRNGKPGWLSKPTRQADITIVTSDNQLLPNVRSDIAKLAEKKLKALGVDVKYNTRVTDTATTDNGRTILTLDNNSKLEADLFVPAYGVQPNSSWLPSDLLDEKKYVKTSNTLRVEAAGPRVYAFGDIASNSGNSSWDIQEHQPVLFTNLKRDLLSFDPAQPDAQPKGKDRVIKENSKTGQVVPVGTAGGVGQIFGWKLPSFMVWVIKCRDYMIGMGAVPNVNGKNFNKEVPWTKEEAAI